MCVGQTAAAYDESELASPGVAPGLVRRVGHLGHWATPAGTQAQRSSGPGPAHPRHLLFDQTPGAALGGSLVQPGVNLGDPRDTELTESARRLWCYDI